jgi:protein AATF/BFR2
MRFPLTNPDFDPEAQVGSSDGDDSSDVEGGIDDGRQHYIDVGKSALRRPRPALGPQYAGVSVGRKSMDEDQDEDDPFSRGLDGDSSDEDDEIEKNSASASLSDDGEEEPDMDEDMSETDNAEKSQLLASREDSTRERSAMAQDDAVLSSKLLQSSKGDAEKGRAVKKQKTTFDSLLNSRIKLQKALVGTNTLIGTEHGELHENLARAKNALEAAETAAWAYWSSISNLRDQMIAARTGEKRKRASYDHDTPVERLWRHTQEQEESFNRHRKVTLQKWSAKTESTPALPDRSVTSRSANQTPIIDAIQEHLSDRERLFKRAHTPRSCAPLQLANGVTVDEKIYDDADFYGLLLKELLEQKNQDSMAAANVEVNFDVRREAKARKNIDTKASKGRKLRYTVHEKLQNFMAPEDRGSWGERKADELFGNLFGRRMALGDEQESEYGTDALGEEDGLLLFRR